MCCFLLHLLLRVAQPYVGIGRDKWLSVSAFRQEKLAKAVGVWPDEYGWGLKEVRQTDRQTAATRQTQSNRRRLMASSLK
jgi:hypothetical protein